MACGWDAGSGTALRSVRRLNWILSMRGLLRGEFFEAVVHEFARDAWVESVKDVREFGAEVGRAFEVPDVLESAGHRIAGAVEETRGLDLRRDEFGINAGRGNDRPAT